MSNQIAILSSEVRHEQKFKQFAVISFPNEEETLYIVASSWLEKTESSDFHICSWPPYKGDARIKIAVLENETPSDNWSKCNARLIQQCSTYESAEEILRVIEVVSTRQSEMLFQKKYKQIQNECLPKQLTSSISSRDSFNSSSFSSNTSQSDPFTCATTANADENSLRSSSPITYTKKSERGSLSTKTESLLEDASRLSVLSRTSDLQILNEANAKNKSHEGLIKPELFNCQTSAKYKKYAIVDFIEETEVEVVPSSWLVNKNGVKWPSSKSLIAIRKLIKECSTPEEDWKTMPIRILGFSRSFKSANIKATLGQDTSSVGTDSSESEQEDINRGRKRVRPRRYDSSSEDDLDVPAACVPNKKLRVSDPTILREMLPCTSRMEDESQESLSLSFTSSRNLQPTPPTSEPFPPAPQEGNIEVTMLTRILKSLESIQSDIKVMKSEQAKIQCALSNISNKNESVQGLSWSPPDGIFLPAETEHQLHQMNICLREDKSLIPDLARYLCGCSSGKTLYAFILSLTRRVLCKDVALLYSRLGRKGKKSFASVPEVYNAIIAAAALKFPDVPKEDLAEKFGRVLASASDWDGSPRTTNKNKLTANCNTIKLE